MNFSEEERAEFEEQLESIDEKTLMVQILMELKAINQALREPQDQSESKAEVYLCEPCGEEIPAEKRKTHAMKVHNAPELPVEDYGLFSKM